MTTTITTVYVGYNSGDITCYQHAGASLKASIDTARSNQIYFTDTYGDKFFVPTEAECKAFQAEGFDLVCETCGA